MTDNVRVLEIFYVLQSFVLLFEFIPLMELFYGNFKINRCILERSVSRKLESHAVIHLPYNPADAPDVNGPRGQCLRLYDP